MEYGLDLLSRTKEQLTGDLKALGEPAYRGKQLFGRLHQKQVSDISDVTEFPTDLRDRIKKQSQLYRLKTVERQVSADQTVKLLLRLADGNTIETVVLHYEVGNTACISSQVGCAMGCVFCASTLDGKVRDLTPGEMAGQVYAAAAETGRRIDRVVVMGIGEPLDNFDNLVAFCDIIADSDGYNLSRRGITVSTCGIVPRIKELADLRLPLTLSVSLHAATDEKRSAIMPINRKYPLGELIPACAAYAKKTGRRITFEYAVIPDENDTEKDAWDLAVLLKGTAAHVNLIPVNPVVGKAFSGSRSGTAAFRTMLMKLGVNATVRRTLGGDIDAACGQLRHKRKTEIKATDGGTTF